MPRLDPSRPAPNVNASCEPEYRRSSNQRSILYRPAYNWSPATFAIVASADRLYVCIQGLSRKPESSSTRPYLALVFDTGHDGGDAPDRDDLNLSIDEEGRLTEYFGNGVGFVPQESRSGWSATTNRSQEIGWNAEYSISLNKINAGPGSVVGFQIRHTSLVRDNDSFSWPEASQNRRPETWGDLFFLGPTTSTPGTVLVDTARVTQGLDWDIAHRANVPYDWVAGKDAFMSAQLYTSGGVADVVYSACIIQRISPVLDPPIVRPPESAPRPRVYPYPQGVFVGSGQFQCWIPGSDLRSPGLYRFAIQAQMAGGEIQTVELGERLVRESRAVRVLLYRWVFPAGHDEYRLWDATLNASGDDAMRDLQRVLPVPAGVGPFSFSGTPGPSAPGLRYFWVPTVYQCVVTGSETRAQAVARCDATARNNGDLARMEYDRQSARADATDGQRRDRVDIQQVFVSTPESGGGQSCHANSRSAGSGLDSLENGQSHFVPIQETEHCWFQVRHRGFETSPHSDPRDPAHSLTYAFRSANGDPMINTQTRQQIPVPRGMLSAFFGDDDHSTFINEGFEFNDLRRTLLALPPPSGRTSFARSRQAEPGGRPQLQLAFLIDRSDVVTAQLSRRLDDSTLATSTEDQTSPYSLVFRDDKGGETGAIPFEVTTEGAHDPVPVTGIVLVADIPDGSASVEIDKNGVPLFTQHFSASPPTVSEVNAVPNGADALDVSWQGSDPDGDQLAYSVYFQQHPNSPRSLIANGLTEKSYRFDTAFAPGTTDGVITVEVSDGYNTGEGSTSPVTVADKPPVPLISFPGQGMTFVAGQPISLVGSAYDYTSMGPLTDDALSWSSDIDGALGDGSVPSVTLSPGTHALTLSATSKQGLSAQATVKVTVLADTDNDGLPDQYEKVNTCLKPDGSDGEKDPDHDGLSSLSERLRSTHPCRPDTDKDGWTDGDEALLRSNPRSAKDVPNPDRIYLSTHPIDLGKCPSPETTSIDVQTAKQGTNWTVATDVPFLSATGEGPGPGSIKVTADCTGLPPDMLVLGHIGVDADGGQFKLIEVRLHT